MSTKNQKSRRLEYNAFDLKKFKITKDGVDVTHHESGTEAGEITKKGEVLPHPDLQAKLDELSIYMADRLGLLEGWNFSRDQLKSSKPKLEKAIEGHDAVVQRMNPNGLTFTGEGDLAGVLITGSIRVPITGSTGLTVPKITFGKETLGYEKEVEELCEEIKKEVYAYRYQGKKAQQSLGDDPLFE